MAVKTLVLNFSPNIIKFPLLIKFHRLYLRFDHKKWPVILFFKLLINKITIKMFLINFSVLRLLFHYVF